MLKHVLIDEHLRKRIIRFVKPEERSCLSYQNLDLLTAVYDDENDFYLVLTYFVSECIKRCDDNFDDSEYAVAKNGRIFKISCKEYHYGKKIAISYNERPDILSNELAVAAILYWNQNYSERENLRDSLQEQGIDTYGFTKNYLKENFWR